MNIFLWISFLTGHVISIFRQKTYRLDPSEMDIEVFIPAPTINKLLKQYIGKKPWLENIKNIIS